MANGEWPMANGLQSHFHSPLPIRHSPFHQYVNFKVATKRESHWK